MIRNLIPPTFGFVYARKPQDIVEQGYSNTIPCRWQVFLNNLLTVFVIFFKDAMQILWHDQ
jgi:hypothetical protein